jgi:hypothetical protein
LRLLKHAPAPDDQAPSTPETPAKTRRSLRTVAIEVGLALTSGVISLVLAIIALRITPSTVLERWTVGGADQVLHYAIFSSATDVFPFFPNDRLGFPASMNLFFAPLFDVWSAAFVWAISPWVSGGVVALNLYNLASFIATGVTAYFFFRALRTRRVTSVVFGVIFSVLPYHFVQMNFGHPFLANYWSVPLIGVLLLVVAGEATDPLGRWAGRSSTRRGRVLRRLLPIGALALAIALTQSYYFVFAGIVLGCTWIITVARTVVTRDSVRSLIWPTVTLAALGGFIVLQLGVLSLNLDDRYERYFQGRSAAESELYGGKLMSLLLPAPTSGFPALSDLGQNYADTSKILITSENPYTAVVVSVALILVLAVLVIRLSTSGRSITPAGDGQKKTLSLFVHDARVSALLVASVVAFLFFITAGLGAFIAYFASPEIRAWSRMSIVLSLFALGILAILIDTTIRKLWLLLPTLAVICVVAYVDQIVGISQTQPLQLRPTEDGPTRAFVAEAEDALPENCGVVQLPLKDFPETFDIGRMGDYDEALPYVYAQDNDLRWSYGAVRGTYSADDWDDATTVPAFAREVRSSGACAVLVDTYAYTENLDGWQPFVESVSELDDPLLTSTDSDERYILFRTDSSADSSPKR